VEKPGNSYRGPEEQSTVVSISKQIFFIIQSPSVHLVSTSFGIILALFQGLI
jgi:hypothetical protein